MARPQIDLFVLDALANDIEGFEDVMRLLNHEQLGWRHLHGAAIERDEAQEALRRVVIDGLAEVCLYDPDSRALRSYKASQWPVGTEVDDMWFRITEQGRSLHAAWEPQ
jgi:hypothetical protein